MPTHSSGRWTGGRFGVCYISCKIYQRSTFWMSAVPRLSGTRPRKKLIFRLAMQGISGAVTPGKWQKASSLHATITAILLIPSCAEGHHHFQGAFLFPIPLKWGLGTCYLIKRSERELAAPWLCRGGTCPASMSELAEEIEVEHEPPAEPDFYHSLSFLTEALPLFTDETNTICKHEVGKKSQEPWILQWKGVIWALIWLILHFSNKAFFFLRAELKHRRKRYTASIYRHRNCFLQIRLEK